MGLDSMEYCGIAMEEAYVHRMRSSNGYSRKIFRLIPPILVFPGDVCYNPHGSRPGGGGLMGIITWTVLPPGDRACGRFFVIPGRKLLSGSDERGLLT